MRRTSPVLPGSVLRELRSMGRAADGLYESGHRYRHEHRDEGRRGGVEPVERWEERTYALSRGFLIGPGPAPLRDTVLAFSTVTAQLGAGRLDRSWCRVVGQLAGLVGANLYLVGEYGHATSWTRTGERAAERAGDEGLAAWLVAQRAVTALLAGSAVFAVRAAQSAQERASRGGRGSGAGAVWGATVEARARARLGQRREAALAMERARDHFARWDGASREEDMLGFAELFLRWTEGNVCTHLGDADAARGALARALRLASADNLLFCQLLRLESELCRARSGDVWSACEAAREALLDMSEPFRTGVGQTWVRELLDVVPVQRRDLECVRELRSLLVPRLSLPPDDQGPGKVPSPQVTHSARGFAAVTADAPCSTWAVM